MGDWDTLIEQLSFSWNTLIEESVHRQLSYIQIILYYAVKPELGRPVYSSARAKSPSIQFGQSQVTQYTFRPEPSHPVYCTVKPEPSHPVYSSARAKSPSILFN